MKTVFMGTPDFAAGILQALLDSEYEVTAVFSQPDKPKGRKAVLQAPPVKELALLHGIPVYQPVKIRTEENVQILRDLAPDFIVVAAFGQIIPKSILDIHQEAEDKCITQSVASCTLIAELGGREMHIVPGSEKNIKITTTEDLEILKALMRTQKENWLK